MVEFSGYSKINGSAAYALSVAISFANAKVSIGEAGERSDLNKMAI